MTQVRGGAAVWAAGGPGLVLAGVLGLGMVLAGAGNPARADAPAVVTVPAPAAGQIPQANVTNVRCHIVPPNLATGAPVVRPACDTHPQGAAGTAPRQFSLSNMGGPVVTSAQQHFVFLNCVSNCLTDWGNPIGFVSDLFASTFMHVVDQYLGTTASGRYATSGTVAQITLTLPHIMHDSDVQTLVLAAINQTFNPSGGGGGYNQLYSFFLPQGQDLCFDNTNTQCYSPDNNNIFVFCAYHGSFDATDKTGAPIHVLYQAMPYQNVIGCQTSGGPNGVLADSTNSVLSHELIETITDPDLDAWFDFNSGNEISDNCAFLRQNPITLNGRQYDIQPEWSNAFPDQTSDDGTNGTGSACVGYNPLVTTHDFNFNQASDIAWRDISGNTAIWLMQNAAVTSSGGLGPVPTSWTIVGQRDFNGDGKFDLLWHDGASGTVAVWFLNGGSVTGTATLGTVPTSVWSVVGTADFDGDGKGDILWRDTSGNVAIWLTNGSSVTASAGLGMVPLNWIVAGTGDFNGDGKADILWRDTTGGAVAIWFMNGTSVASAGSLGIVDPARWSIIGTGDFNGDQKSDILWRDSTTNTVAVWEMNGLSVIASAAIGVVPSTWSVADTGDFNFDFKSDLLWRDTSGNIAMWFMNGTSVTSSAGVGNVSTVWTIQGRNVD